MERSWLIHQLISIAAGNLTLQAPEKENVSEATLGQGGENKGGGESAAGRH